MSAVVVQDVYKKFGKPGDPFWKKFLRLNGAEGASNGHNGNGNGHNNNGHSSNGKDILSETAVIVQTEGLNGPANGKPQISMGALPKESLVKAVNEVLLIK